MKLAQILIDFHVYIHEKVSPRPKEFQGIDEIIRTGHIDAKTECPCKSLPANKERK